MADQKISELTALTGANVADDDAIAIVDTSATETKKIVFSELKNALDTATGFVRITGDTMTGDLALSGADVTFGDNDKAIFGAGSDLSIYHDSASGQSIIHENGPSVLKIRATDFRISNAANTADYLSANNGAEVSIRYNGAVKLATTNTGVDITGTLTSDGLTVNSGTNNTVAKFESSDAGAFIILEDSGSTNDGNRIAVEGDVMSFATGDSERMRISSAGNVGIGTSSPQGVLDLGAASSGRSLTFAKYNNIFGSYSEGSLNLTSNYYGDTSSNAYKTSLTATFGAAGIEISGTGDSSSGLIQFFVDAAASKTADAAFVPSERMRLDASGNLLVGTTSRTGGGRLELKGSGTGAYVPTGYNGNNVNSVRIVSGGSPSTSDTVGISMGIGGGAEGYFGIVQDSSGYANFVFNSYNGSYAERMRIDSSGNVGIGTSSPSTNLHVSSPSNGATALVEAQGAYNARLRILSGNANSSFLEFADPDDSDVGEIVYEHSNNSMRFNTNASEAMRIDSSGNVGVGITPTVRFHVYGTAGNYNSIFRNGSDSGQGVGFQRADGTHVGSITWASTTVSFNTSSDHRLKENVVDLTGATTRLKQLEPKRFNFIADADTTVDGFLAHEVQSVVPEAIHGTKDAVDADGNPVYQGIDQSKLVPLLVATIKELEARITALENA